MKMDIEQIKMMKEVFGHPAPHQRDKDSFADFTSGLRQNWVFVIALFSVGFWLISNTFENKNVDSAQDARIESNAAAIINLNNDYNQFKEDTSNSFDENTTVNNEIIRRLDNLQKDLEIIKSK